MKQIEKDKLCFYCFGCNREEQEEFAGVRNCEEFQPAVVEWQSEYMKALKEAKDEV